MEGRRPRLLRPAVLAPSSGSRDPPDPQQPRARARAGGTRPGILGAHSEHTLPGLLDLTPPPAPQRLSETAAAPPGLAQGLCPVASRALGAETAPAPPPGQCGAPWCLVGPGRASGGAAASPRRCPGHVSSERRRSRRGAKPRAAHLPRSRRPGSGQGRAAHTSWVFMREPKTSRVRSARRLRFIPVSRFGQGAPACFLRTLLSPDTRNRLRVAVTNGFQRQRSCLLGRLSGPDAHTVFLCQTPPCLYAQLLFPQQWHKHVSCTFARDFTICRIFSPSIRKHSAENSSFMVSHQKGKKIGRI